MISGAVSPAILATDSITPVTIPPFAAVSKIFTVTTAFGIPNACPASLYVSGINFNASSVVLAIIGNIISESATAPAHKLNFPKTRTINKNAKIPKTIDGNCIMTSLKNLIIFPTLEFAYSAT